MTPTCPRPGSPRVGGGLVDGDLVRTDGAGPSFSSSPTIESGRSTRCRSSGAPWVVTAPRRRGRRAGRSAAGTARPRRRPRRRDVVGELERGSGRGRWCRCRTERDERTSRSTFSLSSVNRLSNVAAGCRRGRTIRRRTTRRPRSRRRWRWCGPGGRGCSCGRAGRGSDAHVNPELLHAVEHRSAVGRSSRRRSVRRRGTRRGRRTTRRPGSWVTITIVWPNSSPPGA
jgi:hypothetical protein